MVESLLVIGAGAGVGAGEKNTRSRSRPKTDRLHNTGWGIRIHFLQICLQLFFLQLQCEFELVRIPFEEFSVIDPPSAPTVRVLLPF